MCRLDVKKIFIFRSKIGAHTNKSQMNSYIRFLAWCLTAISDKKRPFLFIARLRICLRKGPKLILKYWLHIFFDYLPKLLNRLNNQYSREENFFGQKEVIYKFFVITVLPNGLFAYLILNCMKGRGISENIREPWVTLYSPHLWFLMSILW